MDQPRTITTEHARDFTDRDGQPILFIVIHATAGENSLNWLKGNPKGTSIHVLTEKDGTCYQLLPDEKGANHVGFSRIVFQGVTYSQHNDHSCNEITLGIEIENRNDGIDPYPEVQLMAACWWVDHWMKKHHLGRDRIRMHRDIDTLGKTDARGLTLQDIFTRLDRINAGSTAGAIDPNATILAAPRGTAVQASNYLTRRGTDKSYASFDHQLIASYYWITGTAVGIDPLMVFAQMVHETGGLTSWWSLRDPQNPAGRRNPAGIGVTGEYSSKTPSPTTGWWYDSVTKFWKRGYAFADWQRAVKAHIGHLLVYAVPLTQQTRLQREIVLFDPRALAVPAESRGFCPRWIDLNGRWAVPGDQYAQTIAKIASQIIAT